MTHLKPILLIFVLAYISVTPFTPADPATILLFSVPGLSVGIVSYLMGIRIGRKGIAAANDDLPLTHPQGG